MFFTLLIGTLLAAPNIGASVTTLTPEVVIAAPRARRPLFIGAELGSNGLTGLGAVVGYQFAPHFAADAALGFSTQFARGGVRGRYMVLTTPVTPFLGIGAAYASGTPFDVRSTQDGRDFSYRVDGGAFGQGVVGLSWVHRHGFTLMGSLGWTQLLFATSNVRLKTGQISERTRQELNLVTGSGPVASVDVGYSF